MNQQEYIAALKQALAKQDDEQIQACVGACEQRFAESLAAGRSEAEIAADLGNPQKFAASYKLRAEMKALGQKATVANVGRTFVSLIGLAFVNLFLLIPGIVYLSLLMTSFVVAIAFFVGGSAMTASGLAGVKSNEWNSVVHYVVREIENDRDSDVDISIEGEGVKISDKSGAKSRLMLDSSSDSARTMQGIALSMVAILLFLLSLLVTKYTLLGIRRYAQINWHILSGKV